MRVSNKSSDQSGSAARLRPVDIGVRPRLLGVAPAPIAVMLVVAILMSLIASGCAGTSSRSAHSRDNVEILYYWGVEGRNRLDTLTRTVTKDLVLDGQITASFTLDAADFDRILAVADSVGFFRLPLDIQPSTLLGSSTPCSRHMLRIMRGSQSHTVLWNDCELGPSVERDRASRVGKTIETVVQSKDTYQRLPRARGGYL
jgi:hypothetical protein